LKATTKLDQGSMALGVKDPELAPLPYAQFKMCRY